MIKETYLDRDRKLCLEDREGAQLSGKDEVEKAPELCESVLDGGAAHDDSMNGLNLRCESITLVPNLRLVSIHSSTLFRQKTTIRPDLLGHLRDLGIRVPDLVALVEDHHTPTNGEHQGPVRPAFMGSTSGGRTVTGDSGGDKDTIFAFAAHPSSVALCEWSIHGIHAPEGVVGRQHQAGRTVSDGGGFPQQLSSDSTTRREASYDSRMSTSY